jgi:hypothetical protein
VWGEVSERDDLTEAQQAALIAISDLFGYAADEAVRKAQVQAEQAR